MGGRAECRLPAFPPFFTAVVRSPKPRHCALASQWRVLMPGAPPTAGPAATLNPKRPRSPVVEEALGGAVHLHVGHLEGHHLVGVCSSRAGREEEASWVEGWAGG